MSKKLTHFIYDEHAVKESVFSRVKNRIFTDKVKKET